jgi:Rrf2 family protein
MRLTLTRRAEYGVRVLLYLAHRPQERFTAVHLAEQCDIPAGNLPTIIATLTRAGIVDARPGRNGGSQLAHDPSQITMLQVVEILEGGSESERCILGTGRCGEGRECALHQSWKLGRAAALGALAKLTLEQAAQRDAFLRST